MQKAFQKKLYRDTDKSLIGGVASGLGHYFGIDPVWIRIALVLLVFAGFGTGILIYIVLWIIIPEAKTTSEKLEMTGEPVNISNIEKKVREEFDNVSEKIKNVDYDKFGTKLRNGVKRTGNSLGDFFTSILNVFAKMLGMVLIIIGITTLIILTISLFALATNVISGYPLQGFVEALNQTQYPIWASALMIFLTVGIPFFFLSLLGFKLLLPGYKSIGNFSKYTLLALWLISLALTISLGISQALAYSSEGRVVERENIIILPQDTLLVKFKHNDYYSKSTHDHTSFKIIQDSTGSDIIYSNKINFKIEKTEEGLPYVQIEKEANGISLAEARATAKAINYSYKTENNHLIFDNYLTTDLKNKFHDQEIKIILFLPKGTIFKVDTSPRDYDRSDNNFFNLHYSSDNYIYKVSESQVKCLNCPSEENEYNDVENNEENTAVEVF